MTWTEDRTEEEYAELQPFPIPVMMQLRAISKGRHLGFGCITLAQLRKWITQSEYRTLRKYGYQAVAMQPDEILVSSPHQCAFVRSLPLAIASPVELWT
jgi:hypothetical protein